MTGWGHFEIRMTMQSMRHSIVNAISTRAAEIDKQVEAAVESLDVGRIVSEEVERVARQEVRRRVARVVSEKVEEIVRERLK